MSQPVSSTDTERRDASAIFSAREAPNFVRAHRHSGRVRLVKRLLPVMLVGAFAAMVIVPLLHQMGLKLELPFEIGGLHLSGTRLTMEVPKLSGFTDDGRAYRVNAATASQDLAKTDVLDLTDIDAQIELANKGWANVKSATGSVDTKSQIIRLVNGVYLTVNGGYAGRLKDAEVDAKAGTLVTDNPVLLTYRDGKLVADRMMVSDRGNRVLFEGNVQLDFRSADFSDKQGAAAAPAQTTPAPSAAPQPSGQPPSVQPAPNQSSPAQSAPATKGAMR